MDAKYRCLADFLLDIKKYVLPDLRRLRNDIRPDSRGLQGCTVPTAMFAFAVLDLVGFLMRPAPALPEECKKNIKFSLSSDADILPNEYQDNTELLLTLFRHGIMHQVLPKAAGIMKLPVGIELPLIFCKSKEDIPILNADKLVDDLVKCLAILEERVRSPAGDILASQMDQRLCFLHRHGQELLADIRTRAVYQQCPEGFFTIHVDPCEKPHLKRSVQKRSLKKGIR